MLNCCILWCQDQDLTCHSCTEFRNWKVKKRKLMLLTSVRPFCWRFEESKLAVTDGSSSSLVVDRRSTGARDDVNDEPEETQWIHCLLLLLLVWTLHHPGLELPHLIYTTYRYNLLFGKKWGAMMMTLAEISMSWAIKTAVACGY